MSRLNAKVRVDVGGFLPFMFKTPLKLSQLAMAECDIAAARDGTQQAGAGLRRGGASDGYGTMAH
jgi:hypothetical protein